MAVVRFEGKSFEWARGESLVDCLERNGVQVPTSCRSGACHSCLVKVTEGPISPVSQLGLKETWKAQGLCLSCVSTEPTDCTVARSDTSVQVKARVLQKATLSHDVVRLRLEPSQPLGLRAGQFINLTRPDGLTRSYSVASLEADGFLELHVRVVPLGRMSQWLNAELKVGDVVSVRGPGGDCFYVEGRPDQPLVLVGTGTGLAPLVGIARDALARGHRGSIALVHGGRVPQDLYLDAELRELERRHPTFRYLPTLSQADGGAGTARGRVDRVLLTQFPSLSGYRTFVCGSPTMVRDLRALLYKLGASLDDLHADAYVAAPPPKAPRPVEAPKPAVTMTTGGSLKPFRVKHGTPKLQKLRFGLQAAIFAGFILQAVLYYLARFRPVGSMLPFMAYDSLGHLVVSSTLVLWATLFVAVFVFGRFVCGWLCPIGFVQDAGYRLLKALKVPPRPPLRQSNLVRLAMSGLILGHFVAMPLLAAPVKVWQFDWLYREPWLLGFPFRVGLFALDLLLLFVVLGLLLPYFFGPRPYCKLVCETGYLLDLTSRLSFGRVRRNEGFERDTCLSCQRCSNICPQAIDVFEEVHLFDRVVSSGCIACMQCVNTCPNETIVYSLRKKATDTGRVAGYLAGLQGRAQDLPRFVLTGLGVCVGAYVGFVKLPPSYFHTYALFSSLGGLMGFLAWRGVATVFAPQLARWLPETSASQVEMERQAKLVPLTPQERLAKDRRMTPRSRRVFAVTGVLLVAGALVAAWAISQSVPPRIATLEELPAALQTPAARQAARRFFFGVPTETSPAVTQRTYAGLAEVLRHRVADHIGLYRAESYGALALAVQHEQVDAAILPAAAASALITRTHGAVPVIGQVRFAGSTTYTGLLVAREGFDATTLVGARVALGQADSLSGSLAPVHWLKARGVRLSDLGEVVYAAHHEQALALLEAGRVDVAATFEAALEVHREKNPQARFQVLQRFEGLPNAVVVTRPSLPEAERARLLEALRAVWVDPQFEQLAHALQMGAAMDGVDPAGSEVLAPVVTWLE